MIKIIYLPQSDFYAVMKYTNKPYGMAEEMLTHHKYWLAAEWSALKALIREWIYT